MANTYYNLESRMKYVVAQCPYCLSTDWYWFDITESRKVMCICGWEGDYEEMALFKLRHFPDGLKVAKKKLKRGRHKKMFKKDEELIEMVIMSYRGGVKIRTIGERYGISYSTVNRMINKNYGNC